MSSMADPMIPLLHFQGALDSGNRIDPNELDACYLKMFDIRPDGGRRHSFAKIVDNEIQALAIFGLETPINGIECYNVGYAVAEKYRGRGLAIEAVNKGLEELKNILGQTMNKFYLEAVIEEGNNASINVANKLFPEFGLPIIERESNKHALHFKRLILIPKPQ